jgi:hypothetical protein
MQASFRKIIQKKLENQLSRLLKKASETEFGKRYDVKCIATYHQFKERIPLSSYAALKSDIERLKSGQVNVNWPGKVQHFAVSSGTSGEGKHIPITVERLQSDARFRRAVVTKIVLSKKGFSLLRGKHISIPGSIETIQNEDYLYQIGEISGLSALHIPKWIQNKQVLNLSEAIHLTVSEKVEEIIQRSLQQDIRSITGAPTWILHVLRESVRRSGKSISKLWPNFTSIISGGVAYAHYQEQINELLGKQSISVLEMYGASEGYIGFSELNEIGWFTIMLENGAFYEGECLLTGEILPIWDWKVGNEYALRVSSNTGLWRYPLKDKVSIRNDGKLCITGRIGSMSDYFGEALTIDEVNMALVQLGAAVGRICIVPTTYNKSDCLTLYLECDDFELSKIDALLLDKQIAQLNRHYAIRRESATLHPIIIQKLDQEKEEKLLSLLPKRAQSKLPEVIGIKMRLENSGVIQH